MPEEEFKVLHSSPALLRRSHFPKGPAGLKISFASNTVQYILSWGGLGEGELSWILSLLGNKSFQNKKKTSFKDDVAGTQHTHTHPCVHIRTNILTCTYACTHIHASYIHAHPWVHACTSIHIIHTHMHACTHTHPSLLSPPSQQLPFSVKLQLFYQPKFLQRIVTRTKPILFLGICMASLCLKHKSSVPCYSCTARCDPTGMRGAAGRAQVRIQGVKSQ